MSDTVLASEGEDQTTLAYFKSLKVVRESTALLLHNPSQLCHFRLDLDQLPKVTHLILQLIQRDYPKSLKDIPPHSRWRHFHTPGNDRIQALLDAWTQDLGLSKQDQVLRLLDLFVVSVLLDAGAGSQWSYQPPSEAGVSNEKYARSEGLAIASLDWFLAGGFSSDPSHDPFRVDSVKLKSLTVQDLRSAFQVNDTTNPLVGLERIQLLVRLGHVCEQFPTFFGSSESPLFRPGHLLFYLLNHPQTSITEGGKMTVVSIEALWTVVMNGLAGVWPPTRTKLFDTPLGDVWPCEALRNILHNSSAPNLNAASLSSPQHLEILKAHPFVAFHKLSQWLTYSLLEPLSLLGIQVKGVEDMTGLAEYRNGGLFVDLGVLSLKKNRDGPHKFHVHEDVIVEWRALTVGLLDLVAQQVRTELNLSAQELPLAKVLEAGACFDKVQ